MNTLKERLERIEVEEPVHIPNLDGTGIAETLKVKVPAWRDPKDGGVYLDTEATAILDKVKARHMGLLTPEQIKTLRQRLGLTQQQISELLQIGEKTWTRWETGRERPSRVINVILFALNDGKIDLAYLRSVARRRADMAARLFETAQTAHNPWLSMVRSHWKNWALEPGQENAHDVWQAVLSFLQSSNRQTDFGFQLRAPVASDPLPAQNVIPLFPMPDKGPSPSPTKSSEAPEPIGPRFEIPEKDLVA